MTEAAKVKVFQALDNNSIEPEFIENIAKDINKIVDEESYLSQVKEFMLTSGQEVRKYPSFPTSQICQLRVDLLREETEELSEAIEKGSLIEVLDALIDLQYVLSGAIHSFGMTEIFDEGFEEVQASNMSKFVTSAEDTILSIKKYKKLGVEVEAVKNQELIVIVRAEDKKVLKGINFKEPRLAKLIVDSITNNELRDS